MTCVAQKRLCLSSLVLANGDGVEKAQCAFTIYCIVGVHVVGLALGFITARMMMMGSCHCLGACAGKISTKGGWGSLVLEHEQGHHMKDEGRWSGKTRCPSVVKTETLVLMYLFKK